jgi:Xaa-Pro aminopeptidase
MVLLTISGSLSQTRLTHLRKHLESANLDVYLVPSADEHLNEYLPAAKCRREWLCGFTGSVGDLLVGREQCWLFVDSRYYEQAEQEVDAQIITICKLGLPGIATLSETLEALAKSGKLRIGFDPWVTVLGGFRSLEKRLERYGVQWIATDENLVDLVWKQSGIPKFAQSKIFAVSDQLTGESVQQKLTRVRELLLCHGANLLPILKLDQIAWLLNLRGQDIPYNPVFVAYGLITLEKMYLFTESSRIDAAIQNTLAEYVEFLPYEDFFVHLQSYFPENATALLDINQMTVGAYQLLKQVPLIDLSSPIDAMKGKKNPTELDQMRLANLKASWAKTLAIKVIGETLKAEKMLSEKEIALFVEQYYSQSEGFVGLSFNTIAALGANASIVHYGTPSASRYTQASELILLDSGAQFWGGTTDDTRTISTGNPTLRQIFCYTQVLRAHINCAMQRFPKGTLGSQLDGITRSCLWRSSLNYGHGTGHGVGAFLNVHEGPHALNARALCPLEPGMITSIEPGFYEPGWGGIRLENLYIVIEVQPNWYEFEPLTYIPFDSQLIDLEYFDADQQQWLENYHAQVVEKLSPLLDTTQTDWLRRLVHVGEQLQNA